MTPATPSPIESISTGEVGPLRTTRYADDPEGAADLATLIGVLARGRAAPASGRP
ncbi:MULTISPECIES: hypothetical protein [unclassified Streptomyces]|uniref:hypothetical protein n=1 Tax=unclassified Streptomyces TaxID=2593676 RepID=UPI0033A4E905